MSQISVTGSGGGSGAVNTVQVDKGGSVTGPTIQLYANSGSANAGSTVFFEVAPSSTTEIDFSVTDANQNIVIGAGAGNPGLGGNGNVGLGVGVFVDLTSGGNNVAIGLSAMTEATDAENCVAIGSGANQGIPGFAQNDNVSIGYQSMLGNGGGSYNCALGSLTLNAASQPEFTVAIGYQAGTNYTTAESHNILLNNLGVVSENHTLRIGAGTGTGTQQLNAAYISGINGNTVGSPMMVTINSSTDQLGVASIPSGGGITTINGDAGSVTGSTVTVQAGVSTLLCGSSVSFSNTSGTILQFNVTDLSDNINIGNGSGNQFIDGIQNTSLGINCLPAVTTGTNNNFLGAYGGNAIQDGSNNDGLGNGTLSSLVSGNYNIAIGASAGADYTTTESSNILFNHNGVAAESNVLRIGASTGSGDQELAAAYIQGIHGVTVASATAVLIDSAGQLGTVLSSERYKDNIKDMSDRSSAILELRPVNFSYKSDITSTTQWGLVAEEVYEVFPDLVNLDKEGRPDNVRYHDMPAILLRELQKAVHRIDELEQKLSALGGS
jgi:hypothetical protein